MAYSRADRFWKASIHVFAMPSHPRPKHVPLLRHPRRKDHIRLQDPLTPPGYGLWHPARHHRQLTRWRRSWDEDLYFPAESPHSCIPLRPCERRGRDRPYWPEKHSLCLAGSDQGLRMGATGTHRKVHTSSREIDHPVCLGSVQHPYSPGLFPFWWYGESDHVLRVADCDLWRSTEHPCRRA